MIRFITDCGSRSTILGKAVDYTITGTLIASAFWWEFGVPQALYDREHQHVTILPGVHFQTPYLPPERLSFVSSDHALLVERAFKD